jgi:hypothetical protein
MSIRPIRVDGDVAYVPLTKGYVAVIDALDVHLVERWNWGAKQDARTVYAKRGFKCGGRQHSLLIHRVILEAPAGVEVDHINGNGLDNRRSNLRLATKSQNMQNMRLSRINTSGFKGVCWDKDRGKWRAHITLDRKT